MNRYEFARDLLCVGAALLLFPLPAVSDPFVWGGSSNSAFNNPDNWTVIGETPDVAPGPADAVNFFGGSNPVVTFAGGTSTMSTLVQNGAFQFQLNAGEYTTDLDAFTGADLSLINGTLSGAFMKIGATSTITLESSTTSLVATDTLTLFTSGVLLANEGTVDAQAATVRGFSTILVNGGTFNVDTLTIGQNDFGTSRVTLVNATLNLGSEIIVGQNATGDLNIGAQTVIDLGVDQLTLNTTSTSRADLDIFDGGVLNLNGDAVFGTTGLVSVEVEDGGVLTLDTLILGTAGSGNLAVRGDTSQLDIASGPLVLGLNAGSSGDFTIGEHAFVALPASLIVGDAGGGDLRTDDGILTIAGDLIFGNQTSGHGDWSIDASDGLLVDIAGDLIVGHFGDSEIEAEAENATIHATNLVVGNFDVGLGFFDEFSDSVIDIVGNSTIGNEALGVWNINGGEWHSGGDVAVGRSAGGNVSLSGTSVTSAELLIGEIATGDGYVELYSASWEVGNGLIVGVAGTAVLEAYDGTLVTSSFTEVGTDPSADGTMSFGGASEIHTTMLTVGISGTGKVAIESAARAFTDNVDIATQAGSSGELIVSGAGSELNVTGAITLDRNGEGTLIVEAGARTISDTVTVDYGGAPTFNAIVTGSGSLWETNRLSIGTDSVNGALLIEDGGTFACASECEIGGYTGFRGLARVTGLDAVFDIGTDLNIGNRAGLPGVGGEGRVEILSDGLVEVQGTTIIHNDGQFTLGSFLLDGGTLTTESFLNRGPFDFFDGLLDVHHGTFDNGTPTFTVNGLETNDDPTLRLRDGAQSIGFTDIVTIGAINQGNLEILSAAQLTSNGGSLGVGADAEGHATVTGEDSRWDAGSAPLTVADLGDATLNVLQGGEVSSAGGFIAKSPDSTGEVVLEGIGLKWFSSLNINVGGDGLSDGGAGTLLLRDGASVSAPMITVFQPGRLEGIGTVIGDVENRGAVAPGLSPGRLRIDGDYSQLDTGELTIELGGLSSGNGFDLLEVTGEALLDGRITVRLVSNFIPELGDTFRFLTAVNVDGVFAEQILPEFGTLTLQIIYGANFVELATIEISAVPLPATLWMFVAGLGAVFIRRRTT